MFFRMSEKSYGTNLWWVWGVQEGLGKYQTLTNNKLTLAQVNNALYILYLLAMTNNSRGWLFLDICCYTIVQSLMYQ